METVMTARELRQQIAFRACLTTAVLHQARGKVKEKLRAANLKVHHYSAREITEMAEQWLAEPGHREIITQIVRPYVHEMIFKTKR